MDKPTNTEDLMKILKNNDRKKIITYPQLSRINKIEDLLPKKEDFIIILYLTKENYGHWICLTRRDNVIEFFDPYGYQIDTELKWADRDFREKSNSNYPYLLELLTDAANRGYEIHFNHYNLQKKDPKISTCGYHSALRCVFKHLNLEEYVNFLLKLKKIFKINNIDKLVYTVSKLIEK